MFRWKEVMAGPTERRETRIWLGLRLPTLSMGVMVWNQAGIFRPSGVSEKYHTAFQQYLRPSCKLKEFDNLQEINKRFSVISNIEAIEVRGQENLLRC